MNEKLERDFSLFARDRHIPTTTLDGYKQRMTALYIEPTIVEERNLNVTQISVFSRLFMDRILWLGSEVNNDVANILNSQLLFLNMENPDKKVSIYINSPGGSVSDGMSIYDVFKSIDCPIETICCGTAASMAGILLASGSKGLRKSLPHSQIMLHAPSGGTGRVTAPDFRIAAQEMEKCEAMLYRTLAEETGKDYDYIKQICDRDFWMTPEEAINLNVIDSIIPKRK